MKFNLDQKVYVQCGEFLYHGSMGLSDDNFLHLKDADLLIIVEDGELEGTPLYGRDVSIRLEKIDAIFDGFESEPVKEEEYLGE